MPTRKQHIALGVTMVCLGLLNVALHVLANSRLQTLIWSVYTVAGFGFLWNQGLNAESNTADSNTQQ